MSETRFTIILQKIKIKIYSSSTIPYPKEWSLSTEPELHPSPNFTQPMSLTEFSVNILYFFQLYYLYSGLENQPSPLT